MLLDPRQTGIKVGIHIALTLGAVFNIVVEHLDLTTQFVQISFERLDLCEQIKQGLAFQRLFDLGKARIRSLLLIFDVRRERIKAFSFRSNLLARLFVVEHPSLHTAGHRTKQQQGAPTGSGFFHSLQHTERARRLSSIRRRKRYRCDGFPPWRHRPCQTNGIFLRRS